MARSQTQKTGIPWGQFILIAVLVLAGGAFCVVGFMERSAATLALQETQVRLEEQKVLIPLMQNYRKDLDRGNIILAQTGKPIPRPVTTDELLLSLRQLAIANGLQAPSFIPRSESQIGSSYLCVDGAISGSLDDFRKFLLELTRAPWIYVVDSVEIISSPQGPTFRLALWVDKPAQ